MIRIAVLFYRFGPYHIARLRRTAEFFDLTAIEYSGVDSIYDWDVVHGSANFRRMTLFAKDDFDRHSASKLMSVVGGALSQAQPEAVAIPGWGERCSLAALVWCNRNRIPVVMMSDSPEWIARRRWWKESVKRQLLHSVSAGLAAGKQHREYLVELGVPDDRIFLGFDVVDNDYFANEAEKARNNAAEIRRKHQLPGRYFLASSRFVPKKNLDGLIVAYARYRLLFAAHKPPAVEQQPWDLVVLGDGPLKSRISCLISEFRLQDSVHLPGFIQYGELPAYYALSKVFIMPSISETWGLTVNEAMACGLPVVVSSRCGCASELVVEGKNGYVIPPNNLDIFAQMLADVARLPEETLRQMGQASRDIIAKWGTDRFASSLQSAVATALRVGPRGGSMAGRCLLKLLLAHR